MKLWQIAKDVNEDIEKLKKQQVKLLWEQNEI